MPHSWEKIHILQDYKSIKSAIWSNKCFTLKESSQKIIRLVFTGGNHIPIQKKEDQ